MVGLRRIHDIGLKWKLLIPFLFLSTVGTTFLILLSLHTQTNLIEGQEKKKLHDYYRAFSDQVDDRERSALSLAYQVARSPAVQEAFGRRDRQALLDLLLPSYQVLEKKFDVIQFHFHTRPAISFLRVHRIYQFGETMESFRHTINQVWESGEGIAGLEWGLTGFGVRGVVPVYWQGEMIGTFEVGYSVEGPFLESLKRRYQMDLVILIPGEGGQHFRQLASTAKGAPSLPVETYSQVFQRQNVEVLISQPYAPGSAILLGPLRDFSGKSIGVVEITVDRAATVAKLARNRNIMFIIMVVALFLSSTLIWWVAVIFLRPVHEIVGMAREIAEGKRVQRIEVPVRDEVGTLADSLNDMLESLNQARREIQQYCDTLEQRVEARTKELAEEKEKYETLVENAPLIVYRVAPSGASVFVNRFVEEILGYKPTEVIQDGEFWTRTAHAEDRQYLGKQLDGCLAEGREFLIEYRGIHKNGLEVFLLNHAIPLLDKEGRVEAVDGIIVDVSERKRLQAQIIQTEELKTHSKISARLAHEIRNPLTSAGGFARRLLKELADDDEHRGKVEIIVQEVGRLEHILKMILSYLRPIPLEFSEVNLNALLREVVSNSEDKLRAQGIRLNLELDESLPPIRADRGHLRHAMETILQNACGHMPQDATLLIATANNRKAVVKLCYPALHMADDDIEHFFSPFAVEELQDKDLEVPLTKVIIHKHGGIITIKRDDQNHIVITITFIQVEHRAQPHSLQHTS